LATTNGAAGAGRILPDVCDNQPVAILGGQGNGHRLQCPWRLVTEAPRRDPRPPFQRMTDISESVVEEEAMGVEVAILGYP
jgi:hypothetical protein